MTIAPVADIKAHSRAYMNDTKQGPIVVTRDRKPVAVFPAVNDEDDIESLIPARSPKFQAILERSRREIRKGRGIPAGQVRCASGLAPKTPGRSRMRKAAQS